MLRETSRQYGCILQSECRRNSCAPVVAGVHSHGRTAGSRASVCLAVYYHGNG